jgi:2-iminoacetate synthase
MSFINSKKLTALLKDAKPSQEQVMAVLDIAKEQKGLSLEQTAVLLNCEDTELIENIKQVAKQIKKNIYGDRLVFFAPLYLSSYCINNCAYCGFHTDNSAPRKKLTMDEVAEQTKLLINTGHKRLLLELGEDDNNNPIEYVTEAIQTIYKTKSKNGEIRRINVNLAATTTEKYKKLKELGIGTYQLFQETYHEPTYDKLHAGPKADYERQLYAHDNAFAAGIDDVGLGVLFGLYDYRFEVLALLTHSQYLETKFGVGPHTISVPRYQPAPTVNLPAPKPVKDNDFLKLIAILRLAVPYTGMIISTRETPEIRKQAFAIGISQTSAGSATSPGGYGKEEALNQFQLSDHRSLDEIINNILKQGYLPSFCTACYRLERTGEKFMSLAKPGHIHEFCLPNSLLTFQEYLEDYASSENKKLGHEIIQNNLLKIKDQKIQLETISKLDLIKQGERDLYF